MYQNRKEKQENDYEIKQKCGVEVSRILHIVLRIHVYHRCNMIRHNKVLTSKGSECVSKRKANRKR